MSKRKRKYKEGDTLQEVSYRGPAELKASIQEEMSVSNPPMPSLTEIRTKVLKDGANIREGVLELQIETAHTIADLEAWRDEIDRTIAFLKARR